uniref:Putative Zinc finger protein Elbow n=1 Tax=Daphnia magna TaxID=35525 RepID=A0A0P5PQ85_9CRUS
MLSSNGNPFLRAEYLNPPPATNTMDSKKSPLALLAQTCSQIGADPTPTTATKTASSSTMTTTTTTGHPSGESRKKSASECLAHDNRHEPRDSPSASVVSSPEANNNRVAQQQQQQRPASSANDAGQSLPNAATQTLKTASIKKASDVSSNPNRLTPTDRRSKSTSPKNRSNAGASSGVVPPHPTQAVDHPSASTASTSAAFMNHLLLHPSQQQLVGGSHPSHHHNQQQHHQQHHHLMMAAAALAHGSSDASSSSSSSSSSAAAAMSLANSYKSLMAASAGMAYSSGHPSSMSPYPHSPYSPHHHASVAGAGAGAGASAGYGPPHPSALDFGAYANALNAAAVAKSTSSASSGHPFIATSAATAAMMNGYLAGHPAYSVAALQQAMHQQHYGNAAARMASSSSSAFSSSSSSAAALVQSKPTNSNAESACRDPYCTGCPASSSNNNVAASSSSAAAAGQIHMVCTVGCPLSVQCEHMKVPIAAHHLQMLSAPGASSPGSANGQPPPSSPHHNNSNNSNNINNINNVNNRPYICNWIVADNYCGKRFASSDDLLQHLRTHTNLSSAAAAAAAAAAPPPESAATSSATGFAHPSSMMRAAYPTPPLSPLSAARYHPYGKANGSTTTSVTSLPAQQQQPGPFPSAVAGLFHPGMAAAMAAMASGGPYGAGPPPPSSAAAAAAAAAHLFHMNPALAPYYSHLSLFAHQTNNQASTRQMPGLGPAPLGGGGLGGQP